jgi:hypothetical protein
MRRGPMASTSKCNATSMPEGSRVLASTPDDRERPWDTGEALAIFPMTEAVGRSAIFPCKSRHAAEVRFPSRPRGRRRARDTNDTNSTARRHRHDTDRSYHSCTTA